jgi:hypothetical protein
MTTHTMEQKQTFQSLFMYLCTTKVTTLSAMLVTLHWTAGWSVQKSAVKQQEVTSDNCQIKQGPCKWPWPNGILFWHLPG